MSHPFILPLVLGLTLLLSLLRFAGLNRLLLLTYRSNKNITVMPLTWVSGGVWGPFHQQLV